MELLDELTSAKVRARITELEAQLAGMRVLLRHCLVRERKLLRAQELEAALHKGGGA
jgi:hypothetical protein